MQWANRIVASGTVDPEELAANPQNYRIHSGNQQEQMGAALDRTGWVRPVIVNRRTGYVVDGHMRVALALRKGEHAVPVDWVELTEDEELAILMTFDPIAAMAGTDRGRLRALEEEARASGANLAGLVAPMLGEGPERRKDTEGYDQRATRESSMGRYENGDMRQVYVILSNEQYAVVTERFRALAARTGLESNRDLLMWLIGEYEAERMGGQ